MAQKSIDQIESDGEMVRCSFPLGSIVHQPAALQAATAWADAHPDLYEDWLDVMVELIARHAEGDRGELEGARQPPDTRLSAYRLQDVDLDLRFAIATKQEVTLVMLVGK